MSASSYGRALSVGFLNTLLVAAFGHRLATILGFIVGIMRLSRNWLVAKVATVYIEIMRNIPLLLQIFFWYAAVLKPLPGAGAGAAARAALAGRRLRRHGRRAGRRRLAAARPLSSHPIGGLARRRDAAPVLRRLDGERGRFSELGLSTINFVPLGIFLSNRGITFPRPIWGEGASMHIAAARPRIVLSLAIATGRAAARSRPVSSSPRIAVSLGADHRLAAARPPGDRLRIDLRISRAQGLQFPAAA